MSNSSALTFADIKLEDKQQYLSLVNKLKEPYQSAQDKARDALLKAVNPLRLLATAGASAKVYASIAAFHLVRDAMFPKASPALEICCFMQWLLLNYRRDALDPDSFPRFPKALALTEDEVAIVKRMSEDVAKGRLVQENEDMGARIKEMQAIVLRIKSREATAEDVARLKELADAL